MNESRDPACVALKCIYISIEIYRHLVSLDIRIASTILWIKSSLRKIRACELLFLLGFPSSRTILHTDLFDDFESLFFVYKYMIHNNSELE